MKFNENVFLNPNKVIDPQCDIVFVADLFEEDYAGGAEMTSEAIIQESPLKVQKLYSRDVSIGAFVSVALVTEAWFR